MDEHPDRTRIAVIAAPLAERAPWRTGWSSQAVRQWSETASEVAWAHRWALATWGVFLVAALARARHVLPRGFALNDGGLFFSMSRDIQAAGYSLPQTTTYNAEGIPFAYPPLGLYLAAVVEDLTPLSLAQVYWLLPVLGALLAIVGFYALARTQFEGRGVPLLATFGFAVAPRAFEWLIMGGGMTRSFGVAAALFAAASYAVAVRDRNHRRLLLACVLSAVTLATHLEAAGFLAIGVALMTAQRPGIWSAVAAAAMGLATVVLTAPWWGTVLAYHGPAPFLAAMEHGGNLLADGEVPLGAWQRVIAPVFTSEPFFSVVGALGAVGAVIALSRGRWLLPAWWAAVLVLQMRSFATFSVIPTALLAGYAAVEVIAPALRASLAAAAGSRLRRARTVLVVAGVAGVTLYGSMEPNRSEAMYLRPVAEVDRTAMAWIAAETPSDARFVVVPRRQWYADREGEWFPALAERPSVATVQGLEWLDGEFDARLALQRHIRACSTASCLERLEGVSFTHVFVPAGCCDGLRASFVGHHAYRVVYDSGALIAERVEPDQAQ